MLAVLAALPAQAQFTEIQSRAGESQATGPGKGPPSQAGAPAVNNAPESQDAAYDPRLLRLSEILGSVDYLRMLCKSPDAAEWRQSMEALIAQEARGEEARRTRMTAAFNRGYRAFASVYTQCTPSAVTAERQYRAEGATLAAEIVARFGN
ncbi:TIGR02301 family protein [Xaviernesmea oryzae]|uniref:TIGR02301 family protein n=1 Tax=Xaviernesmea oryzae TaxID=464029 RepID=A0A1Q9ATW4_9HYPH|nr:TIGR02301 family protein [Xaviernesmea oryzae]